MSSSTSIEPVKAPRVLDASVDDYVSRVLARIPAERRGVVGLDLSNAGAAASVGVRFRKDLTGVGFIGKTRGAGVTYGSRVQFVF